MRVALTGTPGTGKTTAAMGLDDRSDLDVIHLNNRIETDRLYTGIDEARESLIADLDGIDEWLASRERNNRADNTDTTGTTLVESHLSHLLEADRVIVLRCHPDELSRRLETRGESEREIAENAESEALDVVLSETVARHSTEDVYEIDTTDRSPTAITNAIETVLTGERAPSAGTVSFIEFFE